MKWTFFVIFFALLAVQQAGCSWFRPLKIIADISHLLVSKDNGNDDDGFDIYFCMEKKPNILILENTIAGSFAKKDCIMASFF